MTELVNNVSKSFKSYFSNANNYNVLGQDKEILKIGNVLNSIFVNRKDIEIPKLIVVGSQSSGKSSILNSILGMDILPTGSNMVTRGPLQLELIQSVKDVRAVFGEYSEGMWREIKTIDIEYPNPTKEQQDDIASMIKEITNTYAGDNMNITSIPIYLRIYSPNIPNLSVVDLPGLTMVACTDRGQPKDIKDKIKKLVGDYIKNPKSIIMAVMPARTDIEADIALDLIKEYDPVGERTVGILTKIDLMNEGTDITEYLENKVSKDLQLKLGYYGIKNRNKMESKNSNVLEGLKLEEQFFKNHRIYSNKKYKDNLGIPSLSKNLSLILVKTLKKAIPGILEKINTELLENTHELSKLGTSIPEDSELKSAYIHKAISKLSRAYISTLNDRGKNINTGRLIKSEFIKFREILRNLEPFNKKNCGDSFIELAIQNCEGNHMSFPSPPIEVLEQLIKSKNSNPMQYILEPAQKCAQTILNHLIELIETLLEDLSITRFPAFSKLITNTTLNKVFMPSISKVYKVIEEELECQKNYIWTEDIEFKHSLHAISDTSNIDIMRQLSSNYYKSITYILEDIIPKKIMYYLVIQSEKIISQKLYIDVKNISITELLEEYDEIGEKRASLNKTITELNNAKKSIDSIL